MSVSLPLLSRESAVTAPINSSEFWHSYSSLASQICELFGGVEKLKQIPVFPFEDLQGRIHQGRCFKKTSINSIAHPIEIYFDATGRVSGVAIAYRIKRLKKPKSRCFASKIQKAVEMIHILPQKNSFIFGPVLQAFGPAAASRSDTLSLLKELLIEKSYKKVDSFSLYESTYVKLDV